MVSFVNMSAKMPTETPKDAPSNAKCTRLSQIFKRHTPGVLSPYHLDFILGLAFVLSVCLVILEIFMIVTGL